MRKNEKLTGLIKGRTIGRTTIQNDTMTASFTDGSKMTIKTDGLTSRTYNGAIKEVRQGGTDFALDFEDGLTLQLTTAEPAACVMVTNLSGLMEYED